MAFAMSLGTASISFQFFQQATATARSTSPEIARVYQSFRPAFASAIPLRAAFTIWRIWTTKRYGKSSKLFARQINEIWHGNNYTLGNYATQ